VNRSLLVITVFAFHQMASGIDSNIPGVSYQLKSPWVKFERTKDDDLLTAGLGKAGLQNPSTHAIKSDRQLAYHTNIRALLDTSEGGGFGSLFGPKDEQTVTGVEYFVSISGYSNTRSSEKNHSSNQANNHQTKLADADFSIQIPDNFSLTKPCLVVSPSSGSRDIYGAVGVTGLWALPKGCAVAYTNKGTGNGFYFPGASKAFNGQGELIDVTDKNVNNNLSKNEPSTINRSNDKSTWINAQQLANVTSTTKDEHLWVASPHAHSQMNPEKDWGRHTLIAVELGLRALNDHFRHQLSNQKASDKENAFDKKNVFVIAAAISNGGSAVLRAGELDETGLIDAIVAGEPNINVAGVTYDIVEESSAINEENKKPVKNRKKLSNRKSIVTRSPYDTFITQSVYTPCANLHILPDVSSTAMFRMQAKVACEQLITADVINAKSPVEAAKLAHQSLMDLGLNNEAIMMGPIYTTMGIWQALVGTYPSSYSRLAMFDDPCGSAFKLAGTSPVSANGLTHLQSIWPTGSGIPPTAGINIEAFNDIRQSAKPLADVNLSTARTLCYFAWLKPEWKARFGLESVISATLTEHIQQGISETRANANVRNIPTIIVHGQNDRLILTHHSSRPYYYLNKTQFGAQSQLRYIEVAHAQHFDALLAYPPYSTTLVPLHVYFERALDSVWQHHYSGNALPTSGIVIPTPRKVTGESIETLTNQHLPSLNNLSFSFQVDDGAFIIEPLSHPLTSQRSN